MKLDNDGSCRQDLVGDFADAAFKLNVGESRPQNESHIPETHAIDQ
jgi:hypothetical protein